MELKKAFLTAVYSGQPTIRINTDEVTDALADMSDACLRRNMELTVWDRARKGRILVGQPARGEGADDSPLPRIAAWLKDADGEPTVLPLLDQKTGIAIPRILVIVNFHLSVMRYGEDLIAMIQHFANDAKSQNLHLVVLMPSGVPLPPELAPLFQVIEHDLPGLKDLRRILDEIIAGNQTAPSSEKGKNDAISAEEAKSRHEAVLAAAGLTRLQAESVFAACLVENGHIRADYIWREKAGILNKEGLVELYSGKETFADVGGLDGVKDFLVRLLRSEEGGDDPDFRAKGVLLTGVPGSGKSLIAKCLGNELRLPTLLANPGNLMGSLVGDTEKRTARFFRLCRAMAPAIIVLDEIEKCMPSAGTASLDGGVGARLLGTFLTQMQDIQEPVFWFFTSNRADTLNEAFTRAERIDAIFYVPLPSPAQRAQVWTLYLRKFFGADAGPRAWPATVAATLGAIRAKEHDQVTPELREKVLMTALGLSGKDRKDFVIAARKIHPDILPPSGPETLLDDSRWSPAEIRACCRLARRLSEPLAETAKRIRPVGATQSEKLAELEKWAVDNALDAETGQLFTSNKPSVTPVSAQAKRRVVRGDVSDN